MKLIEFAMPYLDVAVDGFKCELLWWKWAKGLDVHIPLMQFNTSEGQLMASFFAPDQYEFPQDLIGANVSSQYLNQHVKACLALHTGEAVPLEFEEGEPQNSAVHRILWASHFGQHLVTAKPPASVLEMLDSSNDNDHAMSVMAMRLLGSDIKPRGGIVEVNLTPQTYHAALVADVCQHFPKLR